MEILWILAWILALFLFLWAIHLLFLAGTELVKKFPKMMLALLIVVMIIIFPSLAFYLIFGWAIFLMEVIAKVTFNARLILGGILCWTIFVIGIHFFGAWIYTNANPTAIWRTRWTIAGSLMVVLLFIVGISAIGITHQMAWLLSNVENNFGSKYLVFIDVEQRNHIGEGLQLAKSAQQIVNEFVSQFDQLPNQLPHKNAHFKIVQSNPITGKYTKSVVIGKHGVITITYQHDHIPEIENGTIIMTPSVSANTIKWDCTKGTIPKSYRPDECQPKSGDT